MKTTLPGRPLHLNFRIGQLHHLLVISLVSVTLFSVILGSFHHHHDLADHPDCAICAVACHAGTAPASPVLSVIILPALPALYVLLVLTVPVVRLATLLRSRAPPL